MVKSTVATSAMPIGMPGCPDLAFSTASMASARMALAISLWLTSALVAAVGLAGGIGFLVAVRPDGAAGPDRYRATHLAARAGGVYTKDSRTCCGGWTWQHQLTWRFELAAVTGVRLLTSEPPESSRLARASAGLRGSRFEYTSSPQPRRRTVRKPRPAVPRQEPA